MISKTFRERCRDPLLREFNRQPVTINQDVKTTLAHVEALLARMLHSDDNGREA